MNKNTISHYKFTLIELLVVIAIIAITTKSSIKVNFFCFIFYLFLFFVMFNDCWFYQNFSAFFASSQHINSKSNRFLRAHIE